MRPVWIQILLNPLKSDVGVLLSNRKKVRVHLTNHQKHCSARSPRLTSGRLTCDALKGPSAAREALRMFPLCACLVEHTVSWMGKERHLKSFCTYTDTQTLPGESVLYRFLLFLLNFIPLKCFRSGGSKPFCHIDLKSSS